MRMLRIWALLALSLVISYLPVVNWPFSWVQTFFHEISHGFAALLSGGDIVKFELHLRGSGLCYTRGGVRWIVGFFGYAGGSLWGYLLYRLGDTDNRRHAIFTLTALLALMGTATLLWARDLITWVIMAVMLALVYGGYLLRRYSLAKEFLALLGMYVLLDSIRSPLYLLFTTQRGDSQTLQESLLIPEIVSVAIWMAIAVGLLLHLFALSRKPASRGAAATP